MKSGRRERREKTRRELQEALSTAVSQGLLDRAQDIRSRLADHDLRDAEIAQYQRAKELRPHELSRIPRVPEFASEEDAVRLELPRLKDIRIS